MQEAEALKGQRNRVSKDIGKLKREGTDTAEQESAMRELGQRISELDKAVHCEDAALRDKLLQLPNIAHSSVPVGTDASANQIDRTEGEAPHFDFEPKTHIELGEALSFEVEDGNGDFGFLL